MKKLTKGQQAVSYRTFSGDRPIWHRSYIVRKLIRKGVITDAHYKGQGDITQKGEKLLSGRRGK